MIKEFRTSYPTNFLLKLPLYLPCCRIFVEWVRAHMTLKSSILLSTYLDLNQSVFSLSQARPLEKIVLSMTFSSHSETSSNSSRGLSLRSCYNQILHSHNYEGFHEADSKIQQSLHNKRI
ncbi:hypothetical protein O6H91_03G006200 [Diphasiastrum complanatum]|uniref:Uncharacterized protein n=1 Tax=Diphasiastrum complanatum TaxID=34168 RepID=A0ACC2E3E6_DIPCM|nr:hypothetical protein O6H91_03G006200 [Diphasiastrum complanatum]